MKKTVAKVLGTLSIALTAGAVAMTATASAASAPTAAETPNETVIISSSTIKSITEAEARALRAVVPAAVPAVTRPYKHPSMHGYKKSVYQGKYYYEDQEAYRKCVMDRESSFTYGARNGQGSSASGAYQFLDNSWREGLAYMITHELKNDYGKKVALQIRDTLKKTPINKWSREMQDRGFFTVLNYEGRWSGKHHWNATVPGTSCNNKTVVTTSVSYRKEPASKVSSEYKRANSKAANDLIGYEKSLYRGKYYYSDQEGWRQCVMWRESNYRYNLIGAGYNWPYHGAYQFHNVNWKRGLIFMMAKESKQTKDGLNGEARKLKHKNINQWNRYWQDRALFTALNYNGKYSGAHHWAMTNGGC